MRRKIWGTRTGRAKKSWCKSEIKVSNKKRGEVGKSLGHKENRGEEAIHTKIRTDRTSSSPVSENRREKVKGGEEGRAGY